MSKTADRQSAVVPNDVQVALGQRHTEPTNSPLSLATRLIARHPNDWRFDDADSMSTRATYSELSNDAGHTIAGSIHNVDPINASSAGDSMYAVLGRLVGTGGMEGKRETRGNRCEKRGRD